MSQLEVFLLYKLRSRKDNKKMESGLVVHAYELRDLKLRQKDYKFKIRLKKKELTKEETDFLLIFRPFLNTVLLVLVSLWLLVVYQLYRSWSLLIKRKHQSRKCSKQIVL